MTITRPPDYPYPMLDITALRIAYRQKKSAIKSRIHEFDELRAKRDNHLFFQELCFCILTANTSARMGIHAIEHIHSVLLTATENQLASRLKGHYRFYNTRAQYIAATRRYLKKTCGLNLAGLMESTCDPLKLRDYFALTKEIRGIGFKEASHFLRNCGFKGYAILDKHILRSLHAFGVVSKIPAGLNRSAYLDIELKMKGFAREAGIDFDELDLLLWSMGTGEILK